MLLSLLPDQLTELVQAVWQAVVQPEHHPKFLDPVPADQRGGRETRAGLESYKAPLRENWPDEVAYPLALGRLLIVKRFLEFKDFG